MPCVSVPAAPADPAPGRTLAHDRHDDLESVGHLLCEVELARGARQVRIGCEAPCLRKGVTDASAGMDMDQPWVYDGALDVDDQLAER